jgi:hypothetical protein
MNKFISVQLLGRVSRLAVCLSEVWHYNLCTQFGAIHAKVQHGSLALLTYSPQLIPIAYAIRCQNYQVD